MSVEAVIALVTLAVGVPQGVVAVRRLKSDAAQRAGKPSRRGVALALSSALFLGVGLVFGLVLARGTDAPEGSAAALGTTTSTSPSALSPATTTPASSTAAPTTTAAEPAPVVTDLAMSVPPPGCGASAGVDVHLDAPERSVPGEKESREADLEYDDCDGNVYPGSNGSAGLFADGPKPTREQCRGAALRNPIGDYRSIHGMPVGTVLCVVTDEGNVVAAVITALGAPWGDGPLDGPRQPTIGLAVTRWSS